MVRESARKCSHCGINGHNSRTCNNNNNIANGNNSVKIFGVYLPKIVDDSMKKSFSTGNLSSKKINDDEANTGYLSDGIVQRKAVDRERKKGMHVYIYICQICFIYQCCCFCYYYYYNTTSMFLCSCVYWDEFWFITCCDLCTWDLFVWIIIFHFFFSFSFFQFYRLGFCNLYICLLITIIITTFHQNKNLLLSVLIKSDGIYHTVFPFFLFGFVGLMDLQWNLFIWCMIVEFIILDGGFYFISFFLPFVTIVVICTL